MNRLRPPPPANNRALPATMAGKVVPAANSSSDAGRLYPAVARQLAALAIALMLLIISVGTAAATASSSPGATPATGPTLTLAGKGDNGIAPDSIDRASDPEQKGLLRIYRSNILKKTYKFVVYPESAIDNDHEGIVVLRVTVDRDGQVKKIDYASRAIYNSLNKAARQAVYSARPFPAVPGRVKGETFELLMPIRFRLTG